MTFLLRTTPNGTMLTCRCGYTIKEPTGEQALQTYEDNHRCDHFDGQI